MKKLCFIGVSHLGVVAQAWHKRLAPLYPNYQATFFTGPGASLYQAEYLPEQIKAPDQTQLAEYFQLSAQASTIHLKDYHCFIFQSLDYPLASIQTLCQQMEGTQGQTQQFFSSSCLKESLLNNLQCSPVTLYVNHIRQYSAVPIIISMSPKVCTIALEHIPESFQAYFKYADYFENLFTEAKQEIFQHPKVSLVAQPEETIEQQYFTKFEYSNFYNKVNPAEINDYGHKNVQYGKLVLTKLLAHVQTLDI